MIVVNIVPTGLGACIGGYCGDANPSSKLIASVCDTLITHPNVVNGADINEMTENTLYVEGSILDEFLWGRIKLERVKSNRVLVAVGPPLKNETINAVSAARATIGLDAFIVEFETPLIMKATKGKNGEASGEVTGWRELLSQVSKYDFDALAIASVIDCPKEIALDYFDNGGVNPWGGVEAIASKLIAAEVRKPVAHAPIESSTLDPKDYDLVGYPPAASELISECYIHCVMKGLHKAPRISTKGISCKDVDILVTPEGCWDEPHEACLKNGITILRVSSNVLSVPHTKRTEGIRVENYYEAVGMIKALDIGISLDSMQRPMPQTEVYRIRK